MFGAATIPAPRVALPYVSMNSSEPQVIRSVSGILRDPAGRLLLAQRGHMPAQGLWSLPGGRVEPGESDEDALFREVHEETGFFVTVGARRMTTCHTTPDRHYEINTYECAIYHGSARPGDDATELRWVGSAELYAMHADHQLTHGLLEALRANGVLPGQ